MIKEEKWEPYGKKYNWKDFNGNLGLIFRIIVKDEQTEHKLDEFIFNSNNKFREILELLRLKYGLEYRSK